MSFSIKPVGFMLASTCSLSLTSLVAKLLTGYMSTELLNLLRFVLPAMLMVWLMMMTTWEVPKRKDLPALMMRALFITLTQFCFIYALTTLSLVETVVLFSTGPLFIPLLEKLIFGTKVKNITIVALCLAFVGVGIQAGLGGEINWRPELLIGLAAGLGNASAQVCMFRSTKSHLSALGINTWCMSFAAVLSMLLFWFSSGGSGLSELSTLLHQEFTWVVLVSLFCISITAISTQIFRVKAYKLVESGAQLSPLIFTNLLFVFLWQQLFFNEVLEPQKIFGLGLIIIATLLNTFSGLIEKRWTRRMIKRDKAAC
ncbi:MAG: EamA family transporter [Aliivibrio sp.]|uniref:DMT family transporter n=1 Tax=Aliivibrio sp. TaxID=1872443 RepID=UPI001A4E6A38|nr:EamA family transporter [Aliivibrio sp.]